MRRRCLIDPTEELLQRMLDLVTRGHGGILQFNDWFFQIARIAVRTQAKFRAVTFGRPQHPRGQPRGGSDGENDQSLRERVERPGMAHLELAVFGLPAKSTLDSVGQVSRGHAFGFVERQKTERMLELGRRRESRISQWVGFKT